MNLSFDFNFSSFEGLPAFRETRVPPGALRKAPSLAAEAWLCVSSPGSSASPGAMEHVPCPLRSSLRSCSPREASPPAAADVLSNPVACQPAARPPGEHAVHLQKQRTRTVCSRPSHHGFKYSPWQSQGFYSFSRSF